ncbi:cohesin domain-containing protein [Candidatus Poribacteria bacterium]
MRKQVLLLVLLIVLSAMHNNSWAVFLEMKDSRVPAGSTITVPILIDDASEVLSGEIVIVYSPRAMEPKDIRPTPLMGDASFVYNSLDGQIRISFASVKPLGYGGALAEVTFEVAADAAFGNTTPLAFSFAELNEGSIRTWTRNAELTIVPPDNVPAILLSDHLVQPGETFGVPIEVMHAQEIYSGRLVISYQQDLLDVVGVEKTELTSLCNIEHRVAEGELQISFAGSIPIYGSGELLRLTLHIPNSAKSGERSPLMISSLQLNEGAVMPILIDGAAIVAGKNVPTLSVQDSSGGAGEAVILPIHIDNTGDVFSGVVSLVYDASILRALSVSETDFSPDITYAYKLSPGEALVSFASNTALDGNGDLFSAEFEVLEEAVKGYQGILAIDHAEFNEGGILPIVRGGSFLVTSGPITGTPRLGVSTKTLYFEVPDTELDFEIINEGEGLLKWEVSEDTIWLGANDGYLDTSGDGYFSGRGNSRITAIVGRMGLRNGVYEADIKITSNGGNATVHVKMAVGIDDITPPSVVYSVPENGEVNVDPNLVNKNGLTIGFSEPINTEKLQVFLRTGSKTLGQNLSWSQDDTKLVLTPIAGNEIGAGMEYQISLLQIADRSGNFANDTIISFATTTEEWAEQQLTERMYSLWGNHYLVRTDRDEEHIVVAQRVDGEDLLIQDKDTIGSILYYHLVANSNLMDLGTPMPINETGSIEERIAKWTAIAEEYETFLDNPKKVDPNSELFRSLKIKLFVSSSFLVTSTVAGTLIGAHFGGVGAIPGAMIGLGIGAIGWGFGVSSDLLEFGSDVAGDQFLVSERGAMLRAIAFLEGEDAAMAVLNELIHRQELSAQWDQAGDDFGTISNYVGIAGLIYSATSVKSTYDLLKHWADTIQVFAVENPTNEYLSFKMDEKAIKARMKESTIYHFRMLARLARRIAREYRELDNAKLEQSPKSELGKNLAELLTAIKHYKDIDNEQNYSSYKRARVWREAGSRQARAEYSEQDIADQRRAWSDKYNDYEAFVDEWLDIQADYDLYSSALEQTLNDLHGIKLEEGSNIILTQRNLDKPLPLGYTAHEVLRIKNNTGSAVSDITIEKADTDTSGISVTIPTRISSLDAGEEANVNAQITAPIDIDTNNPFVTIPFRIGWIQNSKALFYTTTLTIRLEPPFSIHNILTDKTSYLKGESVRMAVSISSHVNEALIARPKVVFGDQFEDFLSGAFVNLSPDAKTEFELSWTVPNSDLVPYGNYSLNFLLDGSVDVSMNIDRVFTIFPPIEGDITQFGFENCSIVTSLGDEEIANRLSDALGEVKILPIEGLTAGELVPVMREDNLILLGGHIANILVEGLVDRGVISGDQWQEPGDASIEIVSDPFPSIAPSENKAIIVAGWAKEDTFIAGLKLLNGIEGDKAAPKVDRFDHTNTNIALGISDSIIPMKTELLLNYPNPFNPDTWIPYQLSKAADVSIAIYDATGRIVKHLDIGHRMAGVYVNQDRAAYWDGRNQGGESVASGVYFVVLRAGDYQKAQRIVLAR